MKHKEIIIFESAGNPLIMLGTETFKSTYTYPVFQSINVNRFGFNGKEKDDEIDGVTGSKLDFGARIYDSRVARWLAIDPLFGKYPSLSPYNFVANMPVTAIDPDGRKIVIVGSPEYIEATQTALAKLATTEDGAKLVMEMAKSKHNIVIYMGEENKNGLTNYVKDNGDGTNNYYLFLDPNDVSQYKEGLPKEPAATAGHEGDHWRQKVEGRDMREMVINPDNPTTDAGSGLEGKRELASVEYDAVHFENKIRQSLSISLRKEYASFKVFNKKASEKTTITRTDVFEVGTIKHLYPVNRGFNYSNVKKANNSNLYSIAKRISIFKTNNAKQYEYHHGRKDRSILFKKSDKPVIMSEKK